MLHELALYFQKMFTQVEKPATYGSQLEQYIASKNPQNTYDVETFAREYEAKQQLKNWF